LRIYSRELDPGLLDNSSVLEALRRFSTGKRGGEVQVLLQDAATPQRTLAPLLSLSQRLPSVFAFREVREPVDKAYASAFIANDMAVLTSRSSNPNRGEAVRNPARAFSTSGS